MLLFFMSRKIHVYSGVVCVVSRNYAADNRLFQHAVASQIGMVEGT